MNKTAYKNQFNANNYERIYLSVPKGTKHMIKKLAADNNMSVNKYFLMLLQKEQTALFDSIQLSEKARSSIMYVTGNTQNGYDVFLKNGLQFHCKTKHDIKKEIILRKIS